MMCNSHSTWDNQMWDDLPPDVGRFQALSPNAV